MEVNKEEGFFFLNFSKKVYGLYFLICMRQKGIDVFLKLENLVFCLKIIYSLDIFVFKLKVIFQLEKVCVFNLLFLFV